MAADIGGFLAAKLGGVDGPSVEAFFLLSVRD
jgi:hypothetical protein